MWRSAYQWGIRRLVYSARTWSCLQIPQNDSIGNEELFVSMKFAVLSFLLALSSLMCATGIITNQKIQFIKIKKVLKLAQEKN